MTSITASHYALDSHACHKREPGRPHTEGIFSYRTTPYCVPYGVIVPLEVDNLLIPVPASGTHIGFSTLRMEPCWMALGEAAGVAINVSLDEGTSLRAANVVEMQRRLLAAGAVLTYYEDAAPAMPITKRCNSSPCAASWATVTRRILTRPSRPMTGPTGRPGPIRPIWTTSAARAVNSWINFILK